LQPIASPTALDHMDAVTGLSLDPDLAHLITSGRDSHVKVRGGRWGPLITSGWGSHVKVQGGPLPGSDPSA